MIYEQLYAFDVAVRGGCAGVMCGVDEAGRGPLCGPVCCAAVALDPQSRFDWLTDSKKVSEKRRERLYDEITARALCWSVELVSAQVIDEINILAATMLGMKRAVEALAVRPALALIDGNRAPALDMEARTVVKGDATSASIAAASILAKVTRDRYMRALDERYPQYGFARHKGYPTRAHYEAIERYGICEEHRKSFLKGVRFTTEV